MIVRYALATEFEDATVTVAEPTVVRFTGEKFEPVVTVTLNGQNITDQCQFSWGGDMINAGLYTLTVRGKPGSEYDGKTLDAHPIFQIQPLRSTDYGSWGYTYWYREGNYRYYVTAYTNAPLSQTQNEYHKLKPYCLWQAPTGVTSVEILAVGGAGGGSGGSSSQVGGGGNGGSVVRQMSFAVTAGNYYEVRLGPGGAGGAANGAGGNGVTTYLYAGTVTETGEEATDHDGKKYKLERWDRNPETPMVSAAGGTGAEAASGAAGANGTNAGTYDIFVTDRKYGYGGAKGSGTAAGAAGSDISGQGGAGGGTNAAGGKGGDGTLIIRYMVAEATRTQWKQNVQSGDWNTAANWEGNTLPPYKVANGGAEFYMLDGATLVTINSAANAQTLSVNNMAPLTLQINNKLTIGDRSNSGYAYENILIGCSAAALPMTTLEFTGTSSQLNVVPPKDSFGLQIGTGGSSEPTAKMSFKIPASGWATTAAAPLYDNAEESPMTIGSACIFEIDASAMTTTGSANKRCLCYANGNVRVTREGNYDYLSLNQWLASGRVQMAVPAGKRGVVEWQDASGNPIDPGTVSAAKGGIWFYLMDAVDIKDAVVTISKTTAGFTGSPVGEPALTSVKLMVEGVLTDITESCMLIGWKDENGNTVDGSQLTTWGKYTPIVQARPEQSYYGGTVDKDTLPTFEILAAYYHKPGVLAWETTSGWFLDEALTDGVNVYPDNENVQVNVFASGAANVVGKGDGTVASAKVKTVALRGNASDASKYAALANMTLQVKLEQSRSVIVAERGTSYLSGIDLVIASGSDDSAVAYANVQPGATLGVDNVSIGTKLVAQMEANSTLKFASTVLDGSGTGSVLHGLQGVGAGTRTVIVEDNTVEFQGAAGVEGALALQLKPGANNTTANTMITIGGAFTVGSGSTLTVDASSITTAGTYPLVSAGSWTGAVSAADLAAAATVTAAASGKAAKVVATDDGKGLDLVVYDPTVTLDRQSGTSGSTCVTVTYGEAMPSATMPTKTGYTFGGYYTSTGGSGTKYYNADGTSAKNWDKIESTTLYAQWTANTYTITLDDNGGTGGAGSVTATFGQLLPPLDAADLPTWEGYVFLGYFDAATDGTKYYNADGTSAQTWDKANVATLYAQWRLVKYTLVMPVAADKGITTEVRVQLEWDQEYFVQSQVKYEDKVLNTWYFYEDDTLDKNKHRTLTFEWKWSSASSYSSRTSDNIVGGIVQHYSPSYEDELNCGVYVKNLSQTDGDTVYLGGNYTDRKYYIDYNANGGEGEMSSQLCVYTASETLTLNSFTRTGYAFSGWATSAGSKVVEYADGASVTRLVQSHLKHYTLYAVWHPTDLTVTVEPTSFVYDGTAKTPTVTVKEADGTTVLSSEQYDVAFTDNTNVGTATVTVTGKGDYASGASGGTTFKITAKPLTNPTVTCADSYWTGSQLTAPVVVKDGDKTLEKGTDYDLTSNGTHTSVNDNTGYTVTVTFKGNYSGTANVTWKIRAPEYIVNVEEGNWNAATTWRTVPADYRETYGGKAYPDDEQHLVSVTNKTFTSIRLDLKGGTYKVADYIGIGPKNSSSSNATVTFKNGGVTFCNSTASELKGGVWTPRANQYSFHRGGSVEWGSSGVQVNRLVLENMTITKASGASDRNMTIDSSLTIIYKGTTTMTGVQPTYYLGYSQVNRFEDGVVTLSEPFNIRSNNNNKDSKLQVANATVSAASLDMTKSPNGPLKVSFELGDDHNGSNGETMLAFSDAFKANSGKTTLTVDAGQIGPGTYTLMTAASGNALGLLAANATATNLRPGCKAKFVTTETAGVVTKVDLKIERGLMIIFGPATGQ